MRRFSRAYWTVVGWASARLRPAGVPGRVNLRAWKNYLDRYRTTRSGLVLSASGAVAQALLVLPQAYLIKLVFAGMLAKSGWSAILDPVAGILATACLAGSLSLAARHFSLTVTKRVIAEMRNDLLIRTYAVCHPFAPISDRTAMHAAIVQDTERVDVMSNALAVIVLPSVVMILLLVTAILLLDPWLIAAVAGLVPLAMLVHYTVGRRLKSRVAAFRASFEDFSGGIMFALGTMELTRLRGAQSWEVDRQRRRIEDLRIVCRDMAWLGTAYGIAHGGVTRFAALTVLAVGSGQVAHGAITVGELAALYYLMSQLAGNLNALWTALPQVFVGNESLDNLDCLLLHAEQSKPSGLVVRIAGAVTFESVTFRYADAVILTRVEIHLSAGTICAITGTNGAGKTTLAYLLLGLYRAQSGLIRIDGMPLDQLDIDCVRRQISFVPQEPLLFAGTVWENITYGFSDAMPEAVAEAVRCAAAYDVVAKLPFGYETIVGERGVTLSGGECQRLAIARALLNRPKILILDEPNNHLDSDSVAILISEIWALDFRPTVLLITHDSSLAARADRIYTLRHGALVETSENAATRTARGVVDMAI
jgi:ABC-type bacteriocin/lantibiotic exporter with double-glycine peptidase domain